NSKAFTCAALSLLVEEGKLAWNDKVSEILPWFHLHDALATRDLRVVDLVVHRVGLPTFGGDHLWIGSKMARREVLERIRHQKLVAPFRSKFHYQNILYTAAGEIIPAKTGKSWTEFVTTRLFKPLKMNDTLTSVRELRGLENVAVPHEIRGGKMTTMAYDDVDSIKAAAGINSNVRDVAQWLRMHLAGGKQVLSQKSVHEMQQCKTPLGVSAGRTRVLGTHYRSYGLGWFTEDYKGRKLVSHGGALTGMISETLFVPEENLGVVVLTNMAMNSLTTVITRRVVDHYLKVKGPDWNQLYLGFSKNSKQRDTASEKALQAKRQGNTSPSFPLKAYTGTYHNPVPGEAKVTQKNGKLYFFYNARHHGYLSHWQHDTFRIVWINNIMDMKEKAFVRFELDEKSQVTKLHTTWYHPITFDRR
ncbi:MAG: serine hydrolase, partial [Planctomycetota bacterium]|nr:serine hydrolase [Planctomycetota bacterium]